MDPVAIAILMGLAIACAGAGAVQIVKANPHSEVPLWWGMPDNVPKWPNFLRLLALFLFMPAVNVFHAELWQVVVGGILLISATVIPIILHDRKVSSSS